MKSSFAQRVRNFGKPFVLYHTECATEEALRQAINESKSMDLDISIDDLGNPYLGHSKEYYEKSREIRPRSMPFHEAVELISKSNIPVIVDCKHYDAWSVIEEVIDKIGAHRCMVHSFASEFKFDYDHNDLDYLTEWSPIEKLNQIKNIFPLATTTASCKFLPSDILLSAKYKKILINIRETLADNHIDTICLNVPDKTMSDKILRFFLFKKIIPHIGIDKIDTSKLSKIYVGETDILTNASNCKLLGY